MRMFKDRDSRHAALALALMALLGVLLIFLFPGSAEQDSGYHFQIALAAWKDPSCLVKVWGRPLYTTLFAIPAPLGLLAARLLAVGVGVATAWQTRRLAAELHLGSTWLVVPILLAQPCFLELFPDLLTEPLFALVFVIALRFQLRGWKTRGMLVASLLPLARPEGVFLCLLWGVWVIVESWRGDVSRGITKLLRAALSTLPLASGVALWWLAALIITRDPLFILHDWPKQWQQGTYGNGTLFSYTLRSPEFIGPLLIVPLLAGLFRAIRMREWMPVISSWLMFFILHSVFRAYGLFGEAGYPRYMVSVAPATAMMTLFGWNRLAAMIPRRFAGFSAASGMAVLALSLAISFLYKDSLIWSRDVVAIREMQAWFQQNARPYRRLAWSNVDMCVLAHPGLDERPVFGENRERNLDVLRQSPPGTLVFWDDHIGPDWFGIKAADIETAGYQRLRTRHYSLPGVILGGKICGWPMTREVELSLLYKP